MDWILHPTEKKICMWFEIDHKLDEIGLRLQKLRTGRDELPREEVQPPTPHTTPTPRSPQTPDPTTPLTTKSGLCTRYSGRLCRTLQPYSNGCYALARHLLKLLPKVWPKLTSMLVASQYFGLSTGAYFQHVLLTQTWNFETKCIRLFMVYNSNQWPQILLVMLCLESPGVGR